jgi:hypothetical protein
VPLPVVLGHVAERGVDATLRGNSVRTRGEQLGNAGDVEALLGQAESGAQTGATSTNDERVVLVSDDADASTVVRRLLVQQKNQSMRGTRQGGKN